METNIEENQSPVQDLVYYEDVSQDFCSKMKLSSYSDEEEEEEEEEGEEFSFMCGVNTSPIAAEDAFINGQIKPVLLFNQDPKITYENLPMRPAVKKVFVETRGGMTSSSSENDDVKVVVEEVSSPEACTKSNSTGFSKTWRFKDSMGRSNSDGRDAFVFLNNSNTPPTSTTETAKVNGKVKNSKKSKTASLSAHEVYLKSKSKEEGRRRSYLPYRTGLMGFFTNLNGGLTRNVNPF